MTATKGHGMQPQGRFVRGRPIGTLPKKMNAAPEGAAPDCVDVVWIRA